ncbi:hypothetical protein N7470_002929 [Penicillium chermesinum]|nr:hypothetical protein N7470_002929 [Penicillium chermesinum]
MYVVSQKASGADNDDLTLSFDIVGSTGNLYHVTIKKEPECDCPDGKRGNFCKHIIYILVFALKAPDHLQYQLAFLSSEICQIYEGSPMKQSQAPESRKHDGKRKPVEGDCPICFMEFEPNEKLVWCQAACGNNIHKTCFQQWCATSASRSTGVRCVYCRTTWKFETGSTDFNMDAIRAQGKRNSEGYHNIAAQFGLSTERGMDLSLFFYPLILISLTY